MVSKLVGRLRTCGGQTMAEYAVVLAVIGVGVLAAIAGFSGAAAGAVSRATALLP
jgi:Flp pilus assembly pilin Flp